MLHHVIFVSLLSTFFLHDNFCMTTIGTHKFAAGISSAPEQEKTLTVTRIEFKITKISRIENNKKNWKSLGKMFFFQVYLFSCD